MCDGGQLSHGMGAMLPTSYSVEVLPIWLCEEDRECGLVLFRLSLADWCDVESDLRLTKEWDFVTLTDGRGGT